MNSTTFYTLVLILVLTMSLIFKVCFQVRSIKKQNKESREKRKFSSFSLYEDKNS